MSSQVHPHDEVAAGSGDMVVLSVLEEAAASRQTA
jgi:hypothetical protein